MRLLVLLVLLLVGGPVAPARAEAWRWPVDGPPAVARPFEAPAHRYAAGHRGADLAGAPGTPVRAAGAGVVSYAGLVAGRGVVAVVHGPLRTTYEPVTAVVDVGAAVAAGEVVGVLDPGHLGCPAPACLHWGLRRGEDYLDPVRLVAPGPVRLLPLLAPAPVAGARTTAKAAGGPARVADGPVVAARGQPLEDGPVLAPGEPSASRSTDVGLMAIAVTSALGAAAAARVARRRGR